MKQVSSILGGLGALLLAIAGLSYLITKEFSVLYQIVGFVGIAFVFFYVYAHIDDLISTFGSRSARYGFFALVLTGLCLVVLGLVNFIAFRHPKRYDATETKMYSLSPQTLQVVEALKEPVQLTAFFTSDSQAKGKFEDLIDGYRMHSEQIKLTYIDPEKNPTAVRQFGITAPDTVVVAQGKNEKRVTTISEEAMTNALITVTRGTQKQICFLEGHGEKTPAQTEKDGMSEAKGALEKQAYAVSTIQLYQTGKIPEECAVLVVAGPTRPLFEPEKPILENWILNGGRMIFLIDPGVDPALADYLKTWGIVAQDDLVVDPVAQSFFGNAAVPVGVPAGPHKITEDFQQVPVFFPLARSLDKTEQVPHNGELEFLLTTASDQAWGETDMSLIHPSEATASEPQTPAFDEKDVKGPLRLAALVTIPGKKEATSSDSGQPDQEKTTDDGQRTDNQKTRDGEIAVFGDSDFASNGTFYSSINGDLFLNTVSFLAQEEDLISIRPKEAGKQTLSMTQAQANFVFYLSLIIMPAIPLVFGIYTFSRKRNL